MVQSVLYVAFQRVLQLIFLLFRSPEFKELEIIVLRHELAVLRRHAGRPTFRSADRWFLASTCRVQKNVDYAARTYSRTTPPRRSRRWTRASADAVAGANAGCTG